MENYQNRLQIDKKLSKWMEKYQNGFKIAVL
jgi:hypothetical protein